VQEAAGSLGPVGLPTRERAKPMAYLYLAIAIGAEVIATSALKATDGFTRLVPTMIMGVGYLVSFYFLSLTLRTLSTGIAYAVWSGVGIILIALIAWILYGQKLDLTAMIGMALIIVGVYIVTVHSHAGH